MTKRSDRLRRALLAIVVVAAASAAAAALVVQLSDDERDESRRDVVSGYRAGDLLIPGGGDRRDDPEAVILAGGRDRFAGDERPIVIVGEAGRDNPLEGPVLIVTSAPRTGPPPQGSAPGPCGARFSPLPTQATCVVVGVGPDSLLVAAARGPETDRLDEVLRGARLADRGRLTVTPPQGLAVLARLEPGWVLPDDGVELATDDVPRVTVQPADEERLVAFGALVDAGSPETMVSPSPSGTRGNLSPAVRAVVLDGDPGVVLLVLGADAAALPDESVEDLAELLRPASRRDVERLAGRVRTAQLRRTRGRLEDKLGEVLQQHRDAGAVRLLYAATTDAGPALCVIAVPADDPRRTVASCAPRPEDATIVAGGPFDVPGAGRREVWGVVVPPRVRTVTFEWAGASRNADLRRARRGGFRSSFFQVIPAGVGDLTVIGRDGRGRELARVATTAGSFPAAPSPL